jgi:hypothetical protein
VKKKKSRIELAREIIARLRQEMGRTRPEKPVLNPVTRHDVPDGNPSPRPARA